MPKFKKGDRVVYVGREACAVSERMGMNGTVVGDGHRGAYVDVRLDGQTDSVYVHEGNIELIKEDTVSDVVTLKKEDLQKAYAEGCSDVKRVLDKLYPGQTKKADEWNEYGPVVSEEWSHHFEFAPLSKKWGVIREGDYEYAPINGRDFKVVDGRLYWRKGNRG